MEPIQGEAGVIVPDENYWRKVSQLCKKHNILLAFDEVQTGFGRTGKNFAHQLYNVKPDLTFVLKIRISKALQRLKKRKKKNRYDKFSKNFYVKAQKSFIKIAQKNRKTHIILNSSEIAKPILLFP